MNFSTSSNVFQSILAVILMAGMAFAFTPSQSHAQGAKNAVYAELAGNALIYSVNYDRRFGQNFTGRLGVMRAGVGGVSFTNIPIMGNYLVGSGNHRFELGIGPQIFIVSIDVGNDSGFGFEEDGTAFGGTATIGYRYQPTDGGFVFRVGLTPSFSSAGFLPWAGLSLGYAF